MYFPANIYSIVLHHTDYNSQSGMLVSYRVVVGLYIMLYKRKLKWCSKEEGEKIAGPVTAAVIHGGDQKTE